jgi:E3 ubiquitin-protein ligase BAH
MKFGHLYRERLEEAGYPAHWVDTAINYNQLKKCIKRVRQELTSLGLDAATLQRVLETAEKTSGAANKEEKGGDQDATRPLQYIFSGTPAKTTDGTGPPPSTRAIVPKLLVLVDEKTGQPIDATLAPETKNYIHQLALNEKFTDIRITEDETESNSAHSSDAEPTEERGFGTRRPSRPHRLIEVPLTNDSVFFNMLQSELLELASLQDEEKKKLYSDIKNVGKALAKVTDPDDKRAKQDLAHWRSLFELYVNSQVFFATSEQNHGSQKFVDAQKRFKLFLERAQQQKLMSNFKKKDSAKALQQFLAINTELLQNLRFHEFNQTAMDKILKSKYLDYIGM